MSGRGLVSWIVCALVAAGAVLPAFASAAAPPLLGAATHPLWNSSSVADFDAELDRLVEAGANTVRIDLGWSTLEQDGKGQRPAYYVQKADTFFAHARARGLRAIVTFWSTPCWASSAPESLKQGCEGAWWDPPRNVDVYPPSDPADLADAAAWVAQRWGDDMAAIEIWNEPNYPYFFESDTPAADYAPLLKRAYTAVKQVKPGLPVLGPAMLTSDGDFLEELYDEGIAGHFDGLSLRPFNYGRDPYDESVPSGGRKYSYALGVPLVREIMQAHGDGAKRMWFTELGWSSCAPGTNSWCVTEATQARYIADSLRLARDRWDFVEAISIYNLRNKGDNATDRETQMGMLHRDFTPKPSFWAFRDAITELSATPPVILPAPKPAPQSPLTETTPPLPDQVAPRITSLSAIARRGSRRLAVRYALSEPARVTLSLQRAVRRRRCSRRCLRWVAVRRSTRRAGTPGINRARLDIAGLRSGRYRLVAHATDAAANRSATGRDGFRVVAGP